MSNCVLRSFRGCTRTKIQKCRNTSIGYVFGHCAQVLRSCHEETVRFLGRLFDSGQYLQFVIAFRKRYSHHRSKRKVSKPSLTARELARTPKVNRALVGARVKEILLAEAVQTAKTLTLKETQKAHRGAKKRNLQVQ